MGSITSVSFKSRPAVLSTATVAPTKTKQTRMREVLPPRTKKVARQGDSYVIRLSLNTTLEIRRSGLFVDGALTGGRARKFTIVTLFEWMAERAPFLDFEPDKLIRFIPRAFSRLSSRKVKPSVARTALMRLACPKTVKPTEKLPFVPINPWSTFEEWTLHSSAARRIFASMKKRLKTPNKKTGKLPGAKARASIEKRALVRLAVRWNEYRSLHFPLSAPCPDSWENAMLARFGFMIDLDSIGFSREFNGNEFKAFNGTYPQDVPFPLSSCTNLNLTESIPYGAHKALSAHLIEAKKNGAF